MRVFWAIVAVLVLVAAGIPLLARQKAAREQAVAESAREAAARAAADVREADRPQLQPAVTNNATPAEPAPKAIEPPAPAPAPAPVPETSGDTNPGAPAVAPPSPAPPTPLPESTPAETPSPEPEPEAVPPTPTAPEPTITSRAEPAPAESKGAGVEEAAAPKIVKRDDGSMLVDDRFVVKGSGTAESPYEVTWELLVSASETYDPKIGRKKLPGRLTMLDGKYVRLVGHVAYPMFVEEPRELLSMLNQWDGCCIGVPPTPYDAVEVHLKDVVNKDERLATYGGVTGKFFVKPYLAGDWLVGLYVMENATLTVKEYGGFGS